jgi:hypothetical protein
MARLILYRPHMEAAPLPPVCMRCGEPATRTVYRKFSWQPGWIILLILVGLIGLLLILIFSLIMTKRMPLDAPVCDRHRNHWSSRSLFTWLGFFGVVGGWTLVLVLFDSRGPLGSAPFLVTGGLSVVWLFAAVILSQNAIRPTKITDNTITLVNVSPAFAAAVNDARGGVEPVEETPAGNDVLLGRPRRPPLP